MSINLPRIKNEFSQLQTLGSGKSYFRIMGEGSQVLFLGLGPDPDLLSDLIVPEQKVYYLECPAFSEQMSADWTLKIPSSWIPLLPEDLKPAFSRQYKTIIYRPNLSLYPSFWGPIMAKSESSFDRESCLKNRKAIWIPVEADFLLTTELTSSLSDAGYEVHHLSSMNLYQDLKNNIEDESPLFVLSVNFNGLDIYGECFYLLYDAEIPLVVWCIDNPFNLLTKFKSPFWKEVSLLVTDKWFVEPLKRLGAQRVKYLPLATWSDVFYPTSVDHGIGLDNRLTFVGHSEFREKNRFFSACKIPLSTWKKAQEMISSGSRADYAWWQKALDMDFIWPDQKMRNIAYGAEMTNMSWRTLCLGKIAQDYPLTVFGDRNWLDLLPGNIDIRGEVNYYKELPEVYQSSGYTLNLTSFLLPGGLTQRHFDVWAAGGFLITDCSLGLDLFSDELIREISFNDPSECKLIIERMEKNPKLKQDIKEAWYREIIEYHSYKRRMEELLDWMQDEY